MSWLACRPRKSPKSRNSSLPIGSLPRRKRLETPRGNGGCRRDDEEALYPQTRPVLGLYLSLHTHPPPCARRGRNAGILSRLSAFRASDGLDAGSPWAHRTYARAGTLPPPAHPPGRVARPDLARPAGTGRTLDVKKLSQLAPSCRGQQGEVTSKFVRIEDIPDRGLKTRQLPRQLRASLCRRREVHQFLAEKIIQRTLHPEMPLDSPRCPALLYPDPMKPYAHHYTVGLPSTPNTSRQGCNEFVSSTERSLHVPPLTLTLYLLPLFWHLYRPWSGRQSEGVRQCHPTMVTTISRFCI